MTVISTPIGSAASATLPHRAALRHMVVLHAVPEVWLELTQTWIYNQVAHLPDSVTNHALCESTANLDQFPLANLHQFDREPRLRQVVDRALRKLRLRRHLGHAMRSARAIRPDVIHSHFGPTGWSMLDVVRSLRPRPRHVVTFYGLDVNFLPRQGWRDRYAELFDEIDLVLCEGPHMARCIASLGCAERKIRVHHLGVNIDQIEYRPRKLGRGERLRVLMAAAFREKKGLPYAIEALGIASR